MSTGTMAGMGIGGMILIGIITLLMGGNPMDVLQQAGGMGGAQTEEGQQTFSPEEEEQVKFCRQILASTEDVWTAVFKQKFNAQYTPPTLVIFKGRVQTNCGGGHFAIASHIVNQENLSFHDHIFENFGKCTKNSDILCIFVP